MYLIMWEGILPCLLQSLDVAMCFKVISNSKFNVFGFFPGEPCCSRSCAQMEPDLLSISKMDTEEFSAVSPSAQSLLFFC